MDNRIFDELNKLGIPTNLLGRQYLETAIELILDEPCVFESITKTLYPAIASVHKTTPSRVERAIRHAVSVSIDRLEPEFILDYFGYNRELKITSHEYISMVVRRLKMEEEKHEIPGYCQKIF